MTTLLITHPACLAHEMGEGHPERPDRLRAIECASESELSRCWRATSRRAPTSRRSLACIRSNTSRRSAPAPRRRASPPSTRTRRCRQRPSRLRCARPGERFCGRRGHGRQGAQRLRRDPSAWPSRGNHDADGLLLLQQYGDRGAPCAGGLRRGARRNRRFDVHHGNGTQHIFWDERDFMYASTHEMPLFPGTGELGERGEHDRSSTRRCAQASGRGFPGGDGGGDPAETRGFRAGPPDISAGFDAHRRDPLGNLNLVEDDFSGSHGN